MAKADVSFINLPTVPRDFVSNWPCGCDDETVFPNETQAESRHAASLSSYPTNQDLAGRLPEINERPVLGRDADIRSSFGLGSRHEAVMKLQKQVTVPKIEIDLSRIQQLSQEHDDENWEFRSWLKQYAPDDIDGLVKTLSQKYFALIDCTQCANCCRSLHVEFKKSELHAIAKTLGQSIEAFQKQFMSEGEGESALPDAQRKAVFHLRE